MAGSIAKSVSLGIGLISTMVSVHSAKEANDQTGLINCCVDPSHAGRPIPVKRPAMCEHCGTLTHEGHLVKGRKVGDGVQLLTTSEAAELISEETQYKKKIDLAPFPANQVAVHTVQGDKLYFLKPNNADNRYQTIARLVEDSPGVAFLARYTVRTRASLFWVRVVNGCLLLEERTHEQELRPVPEIDGDFDEKMFKAAKLMLPAFIEDFNPDTYKSNYREILDNMTADKDIVSVDVPNTVLYSTMSNEDITESIEKAIQKGLAKKSAAKKKIKV